MTLLLLIVDQQSNLLGHVRSFFITVSTPFYRFVDMPDKLLESSEDNLQTRSGLIEDNARLRSELLVLKAKVQKLASLAAENVRLRELLNSSAILQDNVLAAEIVGISPDPSRHFVLVNKGRADGVTIGQSAIDAYGLLGQIVEVGEYSSRILLITDVTHSIPVQVNRNGVRSIAEGHGLIHELELRHVAATTDIKVDDILVSSGLGGKFPVGYPVARVSSVEHDPGKPFAIVKLTPSAQLDRTRHVLIVFSADVGLNPKTQSALGEVQ